MAEVTVSPEQASNLSPLACGMLSSLRTGMRSSPSPADDWLSDLGQVATSKFLLLLARKGRLLPV
jgi:hypothetical protein